MSGCRMDLNHRPEKLLSPTELRQPGCIMLSYDHLLILRDFHENANTPGRSYVKSPRGSQAFGPARRVSDENRPLSDYVSKIPARHHGQNHNANRERHCTVVCAEYPRYDAFHSAGSGAGVMSGKAPQRSCIICMPSARVSVTAHMTLALSETNSDPTSVR